MTPLTRIARILLLLVLAAAIIWLLFTVVFPWVDRTFVDDPVLGAVTAASVRGVTPW